jgi:fructose-1,6-bisphosphatase I|uniref:Fructose-1,6-bisphosphatase, cytosolic n=1 Tax=viral metagenome TaxID=1070528 RepID=A0A6C0BHS8_9ZZZZ
MTSIHCFYSLENSLHSILTAICTSSIEIEKKVRYSGLYQLHGNHSSQNMSGDVQKKLDVVSNDIMIHYLIHSYACNVLLSEENEEPIMVSADKKGKYLVAFDPLDGSSNIDCNAPLGTIFSISENEENEVLLNGNRILMAGYVLYGPSTEMVIAYDSKVNRFMLDETGSFCHIGPIVEGEKKIYSVNEGHSNHWYADTAKFIDECKKMGYAARYIGSMVADVHRTLLYGGVFSYPADKKNKQGKLRLLYECFPMAKIVECAGGRAIVGNLSNQRILDVVPTSIHQRIPILLGSSKEIKRYENVLCLIPKL